LRYTQDLSIEQVADTLDINYQSANNLLHRAIMHPKRMASQHFDTTHFVYNFTLGKKMKKKQF
jgi:transposase-like protein